MINHTPLLAGLIGLILFILGACAPRTTTPEIERPRGIDAYIEGVFALEEGDRDQAMQSFQSGVRHNPELVMARGLLGDLFRAAGDYHQAVEHYEALTRLDPYTAHNFFRLGLSYHLLNRLQDASRNYLRALALDPEDVNATMNLGLVHLGRADTEQAVEYLQRAVEISPASAVAWANLGVALDARGDHARAESAYRRSLDLDSDQTATLLNLGINLIVQRNPEAAVSVMEQVLRREDSAVTRKRYGDALVLAGRPDDALQQYRTALDHDERYHPAMNEMANVLIAQYRQGLELDEQKRTQAVELWQRSLQLNPNQPRVREQLGEWEGRRMFSS